MACETLTDLENVDWDRWVYKRDFLWFHIDETGDEYGPFDSKNEALYSIKDYCFWLEHGMTRYAAQMAHGV